MTAESDSFFELNSWSDRGCTDECGEISVLLHCLWFVEGITIIQNIVSMLILYPADPLDSYFYRFSFFLVKNRKGSSTSAFFMQLNTLPFLLVLSLMMSLF